MNHCNGDIFSAPSPTISHQMWRKENEEKCRKYFVLSQILITYNWCFRADLVFQKSAKKRAEASKMMEKEMADTSARQEKVDHKLKERIGNEH